MKLIRNVDAIPAFVDQSNIEIMTRLNRELTETMDDASLRKRFNTNVDLIRGLMHEITQRVQAAQPDIEFEVDAQPIGEQRLNSVFEMLEV